MIVNIILTHPTTSAVMTSKLFPDEVVNFHLRFDKTSFVRSISLQIVNLKYTLE